MPSTFEADLAAILGEDQTIGSIRAFVEGEYDPATGTSTKVPSDTAVSGVITGYAYEEIDGAQIVTGDMKVTIRAAGLTEPTNTDKFVTGGEVWNIQHVGRRYAASLVLSYVIQVRR